MSAAAAQEPTATRTTSGIAIQDLRIGLTSRAGVDVVATWTSADGTWPVSPRESMPRTSMF